jgi:hypothetical protein
VLLGLENSKMAAVAMVTMKVVFFILSDCNETSQELSLGCAYLHSSWVCLRDFVVGRIYELRLKLENIPTVVFFSFNLLLCKMYNLLKFKCNAFKILNYSINQWSSIFRQNRASYSNISALTTILPILFQYCQKYC